MRPSDSRSLAAALLAKLDEEEDRGDTRSRVHTSYPQVSMFDHDIDAIEIRGAVDPSAIYIPSSVNAFNHPAQQKVEYEEDSSFIPYSSPTPIREPVRPASFSLHRQGAKHLVPPKHTQNTAHRHPLLPAKDDVPFVRKASPTLNTSPMNIPKVSSDPYGDSIWEDSEYVEMNTTVADNVEETIQDDEPVVTPEELKRREEEKSTAISNNKLGVKIIPVTQLPDKWRSIFRFGSFNPVQSKVFHATYETDENLVVSAPTGSGKTTIFELAFIRMMKQEGSSYGSEPLAIYLAPTKALCNERARDWDERLSALGIRCIEVTGDTGHTAAAINALKEANLIVTTPEKWDSLTRRASAIAKVMNRLALIMIDEVHILREPRGATLEVVISRMKSRGDRVRFVALSASVPNIEDVARWLAPSHTSPDTGSFEGQPPPDPQIFSQQPIVKTAKVFKFGEEFRPTQLERQVYGFDLANEWATHAELDKHLYKILLDHSKGQPVLVFCSTRKSCQTTAETIFKAYKESRQRGSKLPWRLQDQKSLGLKDRKIAELTSLGIAVHHAGLEYSDRREIEEAFRHGRLFMIVSTSTLAVGVNLPAHTVVIKGTTTWRGVTEGHCEYSDIDIQQMMGRAGRPQYDTSGLLIVMCERHQVKKYRDMLNSKTILESTLHENLTEHINSEIGLKTITSTKEAQEWLKSSFLYIRIQRNPKHYAFAASRSRSDEKSWEEWLDHYVENALANLQENELIQHVEDSIDEDLLELTPYGTAMSSCFISYGTMCSIMTMQSEWGLREMVEVLAGASEFAGLRIRAGESQMLNKLRNGSELRFRLDEAVKSYADKVFLYLQVCLANINLDKYNTKGDSSNSSPSSIILSIWHQAPRIAKAICHVALNRGFGGAIRASLELLHAVSGKAWEDTSTIFRQLDNIGPKSMKVLEENSIHTFNDLIKVEPMQLEVWLNRTGPFGQKVIDQAKAMPRYRLGLTGKIKQNQEGYPEVVVEVTIKSLGGVTKVINRKSRSFNINYNLSILVYRSDGKLIDFRRMEAKRLKPEHCKYTLSAQIEDPEHYIIIYGGVDEVAGCATSVEYRPNIDRERFPVDDDVVTLGSDDNENMLKGNPIHTHDVEPKTGRDKATTQRTAGSGSKAIRKKEKEPLFLPSEDDIDLSSLLFGKSNQPSREPSSASSVKEPQTLSIRPNKRPSPPDDKMDTMSDKRQKFDGDDLKTDVNLEYSDNLEALLKDDDIMRFVAPSTNSTQPRRMPIKGGPPETQSTPFVQETKRVIENVVKPVADSVWMPCDDGAPRVSTPLGAQDEVDELDSDSDDDREFTSFMNGLTSGLAS